MNIIRHLYKGKVNMRRKRLKVRYHRVEQYVGKDFFKFWNFYTGADPTHGTVQFVSEWEGWQDKLLSASEAGVRDLLRSVGYTGILEFGGVGIPFGPSMRVAASMAW